MTEQISPEFHAEIILEFSNEYRDVGKVSERTSGVSPEHLEAVGRHLPKDMVRVLPHRLLHAA
jgi:hypothetical protein